MNASDYQRLQSDPNFALLLNTYEKTLNFMAGDPANAVLAARYQTKQHLMQNCKVGEDVAADWVSKIEAYRAATPLATEAKPYADERSERYNQYKNYLEAIFKRGDVICFVGIDHSADEKISQVFASLEDALTFDSFLNLDRANSASSIYVAMNTYPASLVGQRVGRIQENVVTVRALQADMDNAANASAIVAAMQSSAKVPPPSIVVESSTGKRQGIWLVDDFPKGDAKPVMQAIAAEFGTDSAVAEVARVMRVPGFVNRKPKYTDHPLAKLLSNSGVRYTRSSFTFDLSAPQKSERNPEGWLDESFVRGSIYNQVLKFVGHYMGAKNIDNGDEMFALVKDRIERNGCYERDGVTPFAWNEEQVRQQCHKLVNEWETGQEQSKPLALNQKPDVSAAPAQSNRPATQTYPEIDTSEGSVRPIFPYWAITGTSIWDGLVAPALESSSKHAEFIYMPCAQMVMNYLSGQVTIKMHNMRLNLFVGLVSPYGEFFKSSSCKLAHDYCTRMNICTTLSKGVVAGGRTLVGQAGSPEGFGLAIQKAKATHAILFNDELGKFASKAGIESSSFADDLLTWYGSGEFGNNVTTEKNNFHFGSGSYTFGWLRARLLLYRLRHGHQFGGILDARLFYVVLQQ